MLHYIQVAKFIVNHGGRWWRAAGLAKAYGMGSTSPLFCFYLLEKSTDALVLVDWDALDLVSHALAYTHKLVALTHDSLHAYLLLSFVIWLNIVVKIYLWRESNVKFFIYKNEEAYY